MVLIHAGTAFIAGSPHCLHQFLSSIARRACPVPILVETIRCYLEQDAVVQIVDSTMPPGDRFRYGVQVIDGTAHASDAIGRRLGVFADVAALVDHAEAMTSI